MTKDSLQETESLAVPFPLPALLASRWTPPNRTNHHLTHVRYVGLALGAIAKCDLHIVFIFILLEVVSQSFFTDSTRLARLKHFPR
jgi:hypothetical protein